MPDLKFILSEWGSWAVLIVILVFYREQIGGALSSMFKHGDKGVPDTVIDLCKRNLESLNEVNKNLESLISATHSMKDVLNDVLLEIARGGK